MKIVIGISIVLAMMHGLFASLNSYDCCNNDCCTITNCCWSPCNATISTSVDWLYWKARRCDLDLAWFVGTDYVDPASVCTVPGKVKNIQHGYHSGVRIATDLQWCNCNCNKWGLGFEYVYFNPSEKNHYSHRYIGDNHLQQGTRVPGLTGNSGGITDLQEVNGCFDLKLNLLDLFFSYDFCCNFCKELQIFFGTRLAWLDDEINTFYSGRSGTSGTFDYSLIEKNNLNAYGLLVGTRYFQDIWCSFGLQLRAGFSVLYGNYKQSIDGFGTNSEYVHTPFSNLSNNACCALSIVDLAVGLGFSRCRICCVNWSLIAGYEFHKWIGYRDYISPNVITGVLDNNNTNLDFDGLFVRLGMEF